VIYFIPFRRRRW